MGDDVFVRTVVRWGSDRAVGWRRNRRRGIERKVTAEQKWQSENNRAYRPKPWKCRLLLLMRITRREQLVGRRLQSVSGQRSPVSTLPPFDEKWNIFVSSL